MTVAHDQIEFAVEAEGLPAGFLIGLVTVVVVLVFTIVVIAVNTMSLRFEDARVRATEITGYPLLRETEAAAQKKLDYYEVIDASTGVYRMPISRAMTLIVNESAGASSDAIELRLDR
jgi:hypothetical protein